MLKLRVVFLGVSMAALLFVGSVPLAPVRSAAAQSSPKYYAVLVGNDNYERTKNFRKENGAPFKWQNLPTCVEDVLKFEETLKRQEAVGIKWKVARLILHHPQRSGLTSPPPEPDVPENAEPDEYGEALRRGWQKNAFAAVGLPLNQDALKKALAHVSATAGEGDVVIVYFSGHGFYYEGLLYLILPESDFQDSGARRRTCITFDELADVFDQQGCKANLVFVLDACRSAGAINTDMKKYLGKKLQKEGADRILVASCQANQQSWWLKEETLSVFTACLVKAFEGAGLKRGEKVTLPAIITQMGDEVPKVAKEQNENYEQSVQFFQFPGATKIETSLLSMPIARAIGTLTFVDHLKERFGKTLANLGNRLSGADREEAVVLLWQEVEAFAKGYKPQPNDPPNPAQTAREEVERLVGKFTPPPDFDQWAAARLGVSADGNPLTPTERAQRIIKWREALQNWLGDPNAQPLDYFKQLAAASIPPAIHAVQVTVGDKRQPVALAEKKVSVQRGQEQTEIVVLVSGADPKARIAPIKVDAQGKGLPPDEQFDYKPGKPGAQGGAGQGKQVECTEQLTLREPVTRVQIDVKHDDRDSLSRLTLTIERPAGVVVDKPEKAVGEQVVVEGRAWDVTKAKEPSVKVDGQKVEIYKTQKVDFSEGKGDLYFWRAMVTLKEGKKEMLVEGYGAGETAPFQTLKLPAEFAAVYVNLTVNNALSALLRSVQAYIGNNRVDDLSSHKFRPGSGQIDLKWNDASLLRWRGEVPKEKFALDLKDFEPVTYPVTLSIKDKNVRDVVRVQVMKSPLFDLNEKLNLRDADLLQKIEKFKGVLPPTRKEGDNLLFDLPYSKGVDVLLSDEVWEAKVTGTEGNRIAVLREKNEFDVTARRRADGALDLEVKREGTQVKLVPEFPESKDEREQLLQQGKHKLTAGIYRVESVDEKKWKLNLKEFQERNKPAIDAQRISFGDDGKPRVKVPSLAVRGEYQRLYVPFDPLSFNTELPFRLPTNGQIKDKDGNVREAQGNTLSLHEEKENNTLLTAYTGTLAFWKGALVDGKVQVFDNDGKPVPPNANADGFIRRTFQLNGVVEETKATLAPVEGQVPYFDINKPRQPQSFTGSLSAGVMKWTDGEKEHALPVGVYTLLIELPGLKPIPVQVTIEEARRAAPDAAAEKSAEGEVKNLTALLSEAQIKKAIKSKRVEVTAQRHRKGKDEPVPAGSTVQLVPEAKLVTERTLEALRRLSQEESGKWIDDLLTRYKNSINGKPTLQGGKAIFDEVWEGPYRVTVQLEGSNKQRDAKDKSLKEKARFSVNADDAAPRLVDALLPQTTARFVFDPAGVPPDGLVLKPVKQTPGAPSESVAVDKSKEAEVEGDTEYSLHWSQPSPWEDPDPKAYIVKVSEDKGEETFTVSFRRKRTSVGFKVTGNSPDKDDVMRLDGKPDPTGWAGKTYDVAVKRGSQQTPALEVELGIYTLPKEWELSDSKAKDLSQVEIKEGVRDVTLRKAIYASSLTVPDSAKEASVTVAGKPLSAIGNEWHLPEGLQVGEHPFVVAGKGLLEQSGKIRVRLRDGKPVAAIVEADREESLTSIAKYIKFAAGVLKFTVKPTPSEIAVEPKDLPMADRYPKKDDRLLVIKPVGNEYKLTQAGKWWMDNSPKVKDFMTNSTAKIPFYWDVDHWVLEGAPSGTYNITAKAPGYFDKTVPVTVNSQPIKIELSSKS